MFGKFVSFMQSALRARTTNHSVITSNLANADTPDYRARRLDFEASLDKASQATPRPLGVTRLGHLQALDDPLQSPDIIIDEDTGARLDGNNVLREKELMAMAENQILFRATARTVSRHLALLRYTISEGGR